MANLKVAIRTFRVVLDQKPTCRRELKTSLERAASDLAQRGRLSNTIKNGGRGTGVRNLQYEQAERALFMRMHFFFFVKKV